MPARVVGHPLMITGLLGIGAVIVGLTVWALMQNLALKQASSGSCGGCSLV